MSAKHIIALVGSIASGKGAVTEYLTSKLNAVHHMYSSPLRETLRSYGVETSRENISSLSTFLRSTYGADILERAAIHQAETLEAEYLLLDGVRRPSDIEHLKDRSGFMLLYIDAPIETRYERVRSRAQNSGDDQKSFEDFILDEQKESEQQIPLLKNLADHIIINDGSKEDLHQTLDTILKSIA